MAREKLTIRWIYASYKGKCGGCGDYLEEGDRIAYDYETRTAFCQECGEDEEQCQLRAIERGKPSLDDLESRFEE